ncbi:hypothetical protein SDC9_169173 [bioreactor metagenome]|uniref:Uncharacterized protein n=1 Tax=bioreactor metagenome TaxID=1076179 RepID=A0A645GD85_9ZZZZ
MAGNSAHYGAGVAIKAFVAVIVADALDHFANEIVKVDEGVGGDLAQDHYKTGLGGGLTGYTGAGILLKAGI